MAAAFKTNDDDPVNTTGNGLFCKTKCWYFMKYFDPPLFEHRDKECRIVAGRLRRRHSTER